MTSSVVTRRLVTTGVASNLVCTVRAVAGRREKIKKMYKCLRILMGIISLLAGSLLGLLTSYLVQKKNNPYWPYEPWHRSTEELAWNAAISTVIAVIVFYFHSGNIYLIVVKWPPPRLFSWQL